MCEKKGITLYGGNIKRIAFTTVQACKEECAKTEGCVAFTTLAGTNNGCYLKNKDHDAERAVAGHNSARMSCFEGNIRGQAPRETPGQELLVLLDSISGSNNLFYWIYLNVTY